MALGLFESVQSMIATVSVKQNLHVWYCSEPLEGGM